MSAETKRLPFRSVWVRTELDETGAYGVSIETDDDHAYAVNEETGRTWVQQLINAAAQADQFALVMIHAMENGMTFEIAAKLTAALSGAPEFAEDFTCGFIPGLKLVPMVAHDHGRAVGHVQFVMDGAVVAHWATGDARRHAMAVMRALSIARLDSAYLTTLNEMSPDPEGALNAIAQLGELRAEHGLL